MKTIVRLLLALVAFLPVRLWAGKQETPKPIVTPAELTSAAAEVPVMRLDFTLPVEKNALESSDALSNRFFNQPEEMRYGSVTSIDWRKKWDLFAKALIDKAANNNLDATSLRRCVTALNYGRIKQTLLIPAAADENEPFYKPGTPDAKIEEEKVKRWEREAKALKERDDHPERYYNDNLAIVPVGAYLAKYSKGTCWVIVCKWEDMVENGPTHLGHIMVWAMDAKTSAVVAYASCD